MKNKLSKFTITLLSFMVMAVCAVIPVNFVSAETPIKIYVGTSYTYNIENSDFNEATASKISVSLKFNGEEKEDVYIDGSFNSDVYTGENKICSLSFTEGGDNKNAKINFIAYKSGSFVLTAKYNISESETKTYEKLLDATDDISEIDKSISYHSFDNYASYIEKVEANTKQSDGIHNIYLNSTYTVPSMEEIVNTSILSYSQTKRTLHYTSPSSASWSTSTISVGSSSEASFTVKSTGVYKFYMTFTSDFNEEGQEISLVEDYLEERADGFYEIKTTGDEKLYAKAKSDNVTYEYFTDKDCENKYTGEITATKIIPIFSFSIENSLGPNIKITTSYQEDGYIGLKYKVSSITVEGYDVVTDYTLKYSDDNGETWNTASEELISLSFTPTKKGLYRVDVKATDAEGLVSEGQTQNIKVEQEYKVVKFKTSFSEWLSVNTLPFIFLCISVACLIAIICLLFIKPKEKVTKDSKEEDR